MNKKAQGVLLVVPILSIIGVAIYTLVMKNPFIMLLVLVSIVVVLLFIKGIELIDDANDA